MQFRIQFDVENKTFALVAINGMNKELLSGYKNLKDLHYDILRIAFAIVNPWVSPIRPNKIEAEHYDVE